MRSSYLYGVVLLMIAIETSTLTMGVRSREIGVCYGLLGDNLPPPSEVVALCKKHRITKLRLYDPNQRALEAMENTNIQIALGVRNQDIQNIASSQTAANSWFESNMKPYTENNKVRFTHLVVGNEVIPSNFATHVAPAIKNLIRVLKNHNVRGVKVTTAVSGGVLQNSYPPSATVFKPELQSIIVDVLNVLSEQGADLMVNLYPYFAYAAEPQHINLSYAQFTAKEPVVHDGELAYYNLFSAMVDGYYWAMEKIGIRNVPVTVSESGWPSAGNGNFTTTALALTYNKNYVNHIEKNVGTPKKPNSHIQAFIFAMFNENQKASGVEQHWGLFYPSKKPVYPLFPSN